MTFEFGQEGVFKTDWATPVSALPFGVAVDSHENLYFLQGRAVVEVTGAGAEVGQITEPGEEAHPINTYGVAVDPAGKDLYVLDEPSGFVPARVQLQRYVVGCSMPFKGSGCTAAETFTNSHLTAEFAGSAWCRSGPGEEEPVYVTSGERGEVREFRGCDGAWCE